MSEAAFDPRPSRRGFLAGLSASALLAAQAWSAPPALAHVLGASLSRPWSAITFHFQFGGEWAVMGAVTEISLSPVLPEPVFFDSRPPAFAYLPGPAFPRLRLGFRGAAMASGGWWRRGEVDQFGPRFGLAADFGTLWMRGGLAAVQLSYREDEPWAEVEFVVLESSFEERGA